MHLMSKEIILHFIFKKSALPCDMQLQSKEMIHQFILNKLNGSLELHACLFLRLLTSLTSLTHQGYHCLGLSF